MAGMKEPDRQCNALVQRGGGYCAYPAGYGTDHKGAGRCYQHGGRGDAVPEGAMAQAPWLSERMRKLTLEDAEALMSMGTMAMVVARADLMQRLITPGCTPREANDITMSVSRLDKLLADHPELENPDAAPNQADALDEEVKRLLQLEKQRK